MGIVRSAVFSPATNVTDYNPTWTASETYQVGELAIRSGNTYRCIQDHAGVDPAVDAGTYWRLAHVAADLTLSMPSRFATVQAALTFLDGCTISPAAVVTIQVADGTYTIAGYQNLNHPHGDRIELIGNTSTPTNVQFTFTGTGGFMVTKANTFRKINGMKLYNAAKTGSAVAATQSSFVEVGPNLITEGFYYGIRSVEGSSIYAASVQVSGAGDGGFFAYQGGTIECPNAISNNNSDSANGLGFGFIAELGGTLRCTGASASGNYRAGYFANLGGFLLGYNCTATGGQRGFTAERNSAMEINNAVATDCTDRGITASQGSYILAPSAIVTDCKNNYYAENASIIECRNSQSKAVSTTVTVGYYASGTAQIWSNSATFSGSHTTQRSPSSNGTMVTTTNLGGVNNY